MSSYWFGIADTFSEYAATSRVLGANGWFPFDVADILYSYFKKNYQGTDPPWWNRMEGTHIFHELNTPLDEEKHSIHVYIYRGEIMENNTLGASRSETQETYMIAMFVKNQNIGETFHTLNNICDEVRRIFVRDYLAYDLAGIRIIDNFKSFGLQPPNSNMNGTSAHWMILAQVTLYYQVQSTFSPDVSESSPAGSGYKYYAGQWRKEADGKDRPTLA